MKRIRLDRWASQLQPPRNPRILATLQQCRPYSHPSTPSPRPQLRHRCDQWQCPLHTQRRYATSRRKASSAAVAQVEEVEEPQEISTEELEPTQRQKLNFPSHRKALRSSKLSALHARLSLPAKFPLQTLARCLVDPSVDPRPGYNNEPLAIIGQDLLGYYTAEWLMCHHPRLPMPIVFAAQQAYVGAATLASMRTEWGVETVAAPGPEVDAGLLQLKRMSAGNAMAEGEMRRVKDLPVAQRVGSSRRNDGQNYRRGMSSRIVYDDQFGDLYTVNPSDSPTTARTMSAAQAASFEDTNTTSPDTSPAQIATLNDPTSPSQTNPVTVEDASARFIRAVAGALYLHAGTQAAKTFHADHVLSRHLPLHTLFHFAHPTRDLSKLCLREGLEPPVARLISETGRLSRTPVFVVGVFSGDDKLGEAAGSSLNEGRVRAAAAALRSWYLYSPSEAEIVLPSEVVGANEKGTKGYKKWRAQMVDPGEIVT